MISISIAGVNRDANVDYKTLLIVEKLYSHCNTASFEFYCSDFAIAPGNGEEIIITDDLIRIFAGRILTKEEYFMPPSSYKYVVDCIDYHRDLDRKLVNETYTDEMTGDIARHIIATYCPGLTSVNVDDGVLIDGMIVFEYIQPSECIKRLAELSQYSWYVDYSKDVHFFTQAVPNAPFEIDDDQAYYKELVFSYDFSQLRNRVRVKGLGDINVVKQNDDSIAYVQGIEGGDGIYENIIIDETIKTAELAEQVADADLDQYKDIYIVGKFITNEKNVKAGQLIKVDSVKRNISANFLIQEVSLEKITIGGAEEGVPDVSYKPAAEAIIGYKPAAEAVIPYKKSTEVTKKVYYVYHVTIASRLKDLVGLLLDMLHQEASILPAKDITPPAVPSGLTLYTGMGITTQASLAWLKAEWNANDEPDLSHYELRMKKSTDADFTVVTTKNISFIWYSLEPGVTFDVYIRAVDLSGNASNWSSIKSKTTATDQDVPVQLSKPAVVAILAGIKITWIAGIEDNISHYKVERQESDNEVDWSEWSTITEVDATMWLDLLLTYTKYYRYRVSTITQTGTSSTPSDPSNSLQPNQAGTGDIEALSITADLIAANSIYTNALQAGCVVASKVASNTLLISNLSSEALNRMFQSSDYKTNMEAWAKSGAITYIDGGKIYTGSITANKISVSSLAAISAILGTVHAGTIYGTRIRIGSSTDEDIYFEDSGIRMYDVGSYTIGLYKAGLSYLRFQIGSSATTIFTNEDFTLWANGGHVSLQASSRNLTFHETGGLQLCNLSSAPSGHAGDLAYNSSKHRFQCYIGGEGWGYELMTAGW